MVQKMVKGGISMLEQLREWLEGWPGWDSTPAIAIDGLDLAGGAVSLRPGGASESNFKENILGGGRLSTSYRFWLELRLEKPVGDPGAGLHNAALVLALQDWVNTQNARGRVPLLFESGRQSLRALGAGLQQAGPDGLARYRLELVAEHITELKGETDGEEQEN